VCGKPCGKFADVWSYGSWVKKGISNIGLFWPYFWPTVNERLTRLWPGYFLTQPEEIFFHLKGKKIEKIYIFRGNFPNLNSNHKWLTRPDPTQATKNWPKLGQKFLTWARSIFCCLGWVEFSIFGLGWGLEKFPLKIPKFSIFFPSGQKKSLWVR